MNPALLFIATLLFAIGCLVFALSMERARDRARNALELATARAKEATQRAAVIEVDRRLLDAALLRRDVELADVRRELDALRSVLREEEAPIGDAQRRLAAFSALERHVRSGYGPAFTQGAVHTSRSLAVFGPTPAGFADAILRACR